MNLKLLLYITFAITSSCMALPDDLLITLVNETPYDIEASVISPEGEVLKKSIGLRAIDGMYRSNFQQNEVDSFRMAINGKTYTFKHNHPEKKRAEYHIRWVSDEPILGAFIHGLKLLK